MRSVIGCRLGRYGAGSTDWSLVAFRAAKLGRCATPAVGLSGVLTCAVIRSQPISTPSTPEAYPRNRTTDGVVDATTDLEASRTKGG